jgi:hypothetical protein
MAAFIALAGAALADEPTVTLTQSELQEIINAQIAASTAQPAFKKVQSAFTPAPVKPSPTAPTIPAPADPTAK